MRVVLEWLREYVEVDVSLEILVERLHSIGLPVEQVEGMRAINNVVDVTNYVMLELGQPMHAFDYDRVAGGRLVVRRAVPGETLVTLDGIPRTLDGEVLVVADAERALSLAGIIGGAGTE